MSQFGTPNSYLSCATCDRMNYLFSFGKQSVTSTHHNCMHTLNCNRIKNNCGKKWRKKNQSAIRLLMLWILLNRIEWENRWNHHITNRPSVATFKWILTYCDTRFSVNILLNGAIILWRSENEKKTIWMNEHHWQCKLQITNELLNLDCMQITDILTINMSTMRDRSKTLQKRISTHIKHNENIFFLLWL